MSSNYFFTQNGQVIPFDDIFAKAGPFTEGNLWAWGQNSDYPRLGLGNNVIRDLSTPVTTFAGGANWKQVSAGTNHTAAIKTDGTLWLWGFNNSGQLGNNVVTARSTPITTFAGGNNWKQVSCGYNHTAAIKTDGTLWTWGGNLEGKLGIGSQDIGKSTPVTTFSGGANWKQVSTGNYHTGAIKTDGTLWLWGVNQRSQLGINAVSNSDSDQRFTNYSLTPVTTFVGGNDWKTIFCGDYHNLAIKTDGTLWTWGWNRSGQLGNNKIFEDFARIIRTPITTFAGGSNWMGVSRCGAIKDDGTLWTWGKNGNGALGNNTIYNSLTPVTTFTGGTNWKQLSMGFDNRNPEETHYFASAAIKTDGTLWTWGTNTSALLGNNTSVVSVLTPVTTFAGGTNWKQVSVGKNSAAAIKNDGTLWTWGENYFGQLGINSSGSSPRSTPVTTFAGGNNWRQVSCGNGIVAAVKNDGTLWTWGANASGSLGINLPYDITLGFNNRSVPVTTFAGGNNWKQVSCGDDHVAAVKEDGTLWVWGNNNYLGINDLRTAYSSQTPSTLTPVTTFAGGNNWVEVSCGRKTTLATKNDGTLWGWGTEVESLGLNINTPINSNLYTDFPETYQATPVTTFSGGTNWRLSDISYGEIAAGSMASSSAVIKTDGTLWTWGNNNSGQLGNNTVVNRSTPITTFAGGTNWKQVAYGLRHTAAIKTDGTLWAWGDNQFGQVGINNTGAGATAIATPATTFVGGTNWKKVACGEKHTAAIKTDGTLWTWGYNYNGSLGTNDTINRSTPVTTFAGGINWNEVACGNEHTIAIKNNGTLWAWGLNSNGQLGDNRTIGRLTPVTTFAGGTDWKQIACGKNHNLAIKNDGSLWSWGGNYVGQLGINTTEDRSIPVTTFVGGTNWRQVAGGAFHSAAIKTDGTMWIWGVSGTDGRLGINVSGVTILTPVTTFAGGNNWKQVACGYFHNVAVKNDGTLWTWGRNNLGQLGTNNIIDRSTPVTTFSGGTNWRQEGDYEFCINANVISSAIKKDGTLWVWGRLEDGILGNNLEPDVFVNGRTPVTIFGGGDNWKNISANDYASGAIKSDGTMWFWGQNQGIYEQEVDRARYTPVTKLTGGSNWKQLSMGWNHNSAIKNDGTLWTWGLGFYGTNGNNAQSSEVTPFTTFIGKDDWKQISSRANQTFALNYIDPVV